MALEYCADFEVFDSRTTDPASATDLAGLVCVWLELDDIRYEGLVSDEARDGSIKFETIGPHQALEGWRCELRHPDSSNTDVEWQTVLTITTDGGTHLGIRMQRHSMGAIVPLQGEPRPPRLVRMLLEDDRFFCMDATHDLQNQHLLIGGEEAESLARLVLNERRRLPIVAFTPRDDEVIDAMELMQRNLGIAHTAYIKTDASWALDDLLPPKLNVYGGAVRLWWPGVTEDSSFWHHPLLRADVPARHVYRSVSAKIRDAAVARPARDMRFEKLIQRKRHADRQQMIHRMKELQRKLEIAPLEAVQNVHLAEIQEDVETWSSIAEDLEEKNVDLERQLEEAKRRNLDLTAEKDGYLHALKSGSSGSSLESADWRETRFREEVGDRVAQMENASGPTKFRIGASFFKSLERLGEVQYWKKTVQACALILAGSLNQKAAADPHPLRTGGGANDPQRKRPSDEARAFRAYIEQKTPSARRLHYWQLQDGSIEFASVNVHDDMKIPA